MTVSNRSGRCFPLRSGLSLTEATHCDISCPPTLHWPLLAFVRPARLASIFSTWWIPVIILTRNLESMLSVLSMQSVKKVLRQCISIKSSISAGNCNEWLDCHACIAIWQCIYTLYVEYVDAKSSITWHGNKQVYRTSPAGLRGVEAQADKWFELIPCVSVCHVLICWPGPVFEQGADGWDLGVIVILALVVTNAIY